MIIDCFPYFNERELLELRLSLLYDHVDMFVITEGDHTFKGMPKELTCKDVLSEIGFLKPKVKVVTVTMPNYIQEPNPWVRERMQRDIAAGFIGNGDVAYIGDCDEIIDPKYIKYYASVAQENPMGILRVPLAYLCSRGDLRVHYPDGESRPWRAPFMCLKNHISRYSLSQIRESYALGLNNLVYKDIYTYDNGILEDAGWHFSWMGDKHRLKIKDESHAHWNEVKLQDNFVPKDGSTDPLGREDHILKNYDVKNLPSRVFEIPRVKDFLFPKKSISVVQIGTNRANDSLSDHLLSSYEELDFGLFVEPNIMHKESITKCYDKYKNAHVEMVAVKPPSIKENRLNMYIHSKNGPGYEIASFSREHIEKHEAFVEHLKGGTIDTFEVEAITLDDLFIKYNITDLDWLLLDVEGIDAEIIETFDWKKYNIRRVEFEHLHLGDRAKPIRDMFHSLGYKKVEALHYFDWAYERV